MIIIMFMPVGFVFFDSFLVGLGLGILSAPFLYKYIKKIREKTEKQKLEKQFGKALEYMTGAMVAGATFENALKEVAYGEFSEDLNIIKQKFRSIGKMINLNCNCAEAFEIFASKSDSVEIKCFASALSSVMEAGGNMIVLLTNNADIIRKKYEAKEEIKNCVAEQRLNHRIMTVMPVILIFIMRFMAKDYVAYLYTGAGRIIMGVVLILICFSWYLGERIGDIKT